MRNLQMVLVLGGVLGSYAVSGTASAPAQSNWIEPVDHIGGRVRAIAVAGDVAWIAQGPRVWAADVADPAASEPRGPGALLGEQVEALAVDGTRGVAAAGSVVFTLDLTNAASPRVVSSVTVGVSRGPRDQVTVDELRLVGDAAYVLTSQYGGYPDLAWKYGVYVVDVADLARPVVNAELTASALDSPQHMLVVGDTLVVQTSDGARLFDVSQPLNPVTGGTVVEDVEAFAAHPDGSVTGIASSYSGAERVALTLTTWDVSDPALPIQTGSDDFTVGDTWYAAPYDAAYTADGRLFVSGDFHVGGFYTAGGLYEVNATGTQPYQRVRRVSFSLRPLDSPLAAQNGWLFAGGPNGLFVYDSTDDSRHDLLLPVNTQGLEAHNQLLLANVADSGLFAIDLTKSPPKVAGHAASAATSGLSVGGNIACTDFYGGTDIHDLAIDVTSVSDLGVLSRTAKIDLRAGHTGALKFAQSGATLAVAAGSAVHFWDLTDPAAPRRQADLAVAGPVLDLAIGDDGLMVVTSGTPNTSRPGMFPIHLEWFRRTAATPDAPFELVDGRLVVEDATASGTWTSAELVMSPGWVAVSFRQGCADRPYSGGALLYQTREPRWPYSLVMGAWLPGAAATALLLHDGYLLQADPQGVSVVDLRQLTTAPWAFAVVGRLRVVGAVDMAVLEGRVYVSTGPNGIAVFEPDVDWASDVGAPTPTPFRVTPLPLSPTPTRQPCTTATPTATNPTNTPTVTPTSRAHVLFLPTVRR